MLAAERIAEWDAFRAGGELYRLRAMPQAAAEDPKRAAGFIISQLGERATRHHWDAASKAVVLLADRDVCRLHGVRLRHRQAHRLARSRGVVSASVFRLAHPYRASAKYADGLVRLAEHVKRALPGFELRLWRDRSVTGEAIRHAQARDAAGAAAGTAAPTRDPAAAAAASWDRAWARLAGEDHVSVVEFASDAFQPRPDERRAGATGHTDVFGTFLRFFALFTAPKGVPEWAAPPPDGDVAFVCDADFAGSPFDHLIVDTVAWFAAKTALAAPQAALLPAEAASADAGPETAGARAPSADLCTFSFSVSTAERHFPLTALPPLFAGALATRRRWPGHWLDEFLRDAARAVAPDRAGDAPAGAPQLERSRVAGPVAAAAHAPEARQSATYARRQMQHMTGPFVFGADEAFLSRVVVPRLAASAERAQDWLFLVCPPVDRVVSACMGSLAPAGSSGRLGPYGAAAAEAAAAAAGAPGGEALRRDLEEGRVDVAAAASRWASGAIRRSGLFDRKASGSPAARIAPADEARCGPLREALRRMLACWVEAMTAGEAPCSPKDLSYVSQCLGRLQGPREGGSGILCMEAYKIGGRAAAPRPAERLESGHAAGPACAAALQEVCGLAPGWTPLLRGHPAEPHRQQSRKRQREDESGTGAAGAAEPASVRPAPSTQ
ncbi:hypothetical protein FNF31_06250 [Cafeteria roenbergensis]|uniref:Uncharacterized protein n=2 Tax=Cafeteria roenbergensis TaxID=33653 RepID=A0A5A8CNH4_CAFRO|nr:hypothetical protein FNF31_06250 [Cafeteria roenbergensis]